MGRKKKRTVDEKLIHEKAIKIRKKEDKELIEYIENRVEKARSEGFNEGFAKGKASVPQVDIQSILNEIATISGIGTGKLHKIKMVLEKSLDRTVDAVGNTYCISV